MNAPTPVLSATALIRAFVRTGVLRFARQHLVELPPALARLDEGEDLASMLGVPSGDWTSACAVLARGAPALAGPWGQLLRDHQLQLADWFAFALTGECEHHHLLNLAVAELQAPSGSGRPTLHLIEALGASLFGTPLSPLVWPGHSLVREGLLRIEGDGPLTSAELQLSPRLWALLAGDVRPWVGLNPIDAGDPAAYIALPAGLLDDLAALAAQIQTGRVRVALIRGARLLGQAAAARLGRELGMQTVEIDPEAWSGTPGLPAACRYGRWLPVLTVGLGPGECYRPPADGLKRSPLLILCGQDGTVDASDVVELCPPPLSRDERLAAWQIRLREQFAASDASVDSLAEELADQALVDGPGIHALAHRVEQLALRQREAPSPEHLRRVRASFGSERLRALAQPVSRQVGPEALILPPEVASQFDRLVRRCQMRERLWDGLGASLAAPTPGVRALFAGESGAGKTLAASRLASVLGAPLYRVDLAAVMNKYVGETEKNLGALLDEAAALDAILLMDEADALFGRRSEGKDTGERYANMMTNYLLTRIESHPGIVVLTTNARNRLDAAFTRRFDGIIEFPLPGVDERFRLWQSHLGQRSPGVEACRLLASYSDLAGGHIRNAVLQAVALCPHRSPAPVPITLLAAALADEYRKLGRNPPPQLAQMGE